MARRHHICCRCNFCVLQRNVRLRCQERREIERGSNLSLCACPDCVERRGNRPAQVGDGSATVRNPPPSQPEPPAAAAALSPPDKRGRGRWGYYWAAALALIALGVVGVAAWLYAFDGADAVAALWQEPASPAGGEPQVSDAELAPTPTSVPPQPTAIANHPADDHSPTWSSDGRQIAFSSNRYYQLGTQIFVINTDGSPPATLTQSYDARSPAWSPDGSRIAFVDNEGISVMNADGSDPTQLMKNTDGSDPTQPRLTMDTPYVLYANVDNPMLAWSPDGHRIAFASTSNYSSYNREIFVMNADGSSVTQLTFTYSHHNAHNPAWSPDGQRIAFASRLDGDYEIYVMNADGSAIN